MGSSVSTAHPWTQTLEDGTPIKANPSPSLVGGSSLSPTIISAWLASNQKGEHAMSIVRYTNEELRKRKGRVDHAKVNAVT